MGSRQLGLACRRTVAGAALAATTAFTACGDSSSGLDGDGQLVDGVLYSVTELSIAESFPV